MISKNILGERNTKTTMSPSIFPISMITIFILIIPPCYCAPNKHRHRRQLYALQTRHKQILNSNPKPIEFSGSLKDMDSLNAEDKAKLLQNLHNYIVKHAPDLITSERPKIPGIGIVDEKAIVNVAVNSNNENQESSNARINSSLELSKYAKQKIEMALTPQMAILKRKMSKTIRDQNPSPIIA